MKRAHHNPTAFVIFGATGDLTQKKLLHALFHLFSNGFLPEKFHLVGIALDPMSTDQYRNFVRAIITQHKHRPEEVNEFLSRITYQTGNFEHAELYQQLSQILRSLDADTFDVCSNKLFYLAIPPRYYSTIFNHLAQSGLTIPCGGDAGWTRILVEKPFGNNFSTAQELDTKLGELFQEEQIFRIDHYLAKETVQNILTFRFANALFEPVWNNEYVKDVRLTVWETQGVGQRGLFYEDVGALRDVGQNHLLQLLALTAMEDPQLLSPDSIRSMRSNILQNLIPIDEPSLTNHVIRAQYTGYQQEKEVPGNSQTETYFRIKAYINNQRWRHIPFILESGKKMAENKVEIVITFKERPSCVCPPDDNQEHNNILTIRIQPDEGIALQFWAKKTGFEYKLEPKTLSFYYNDQDHDQQLPDAYQKVLYDCIRGDQTLFASTDEVRAAWSFITPIIEQWQNLPLLTYEPGSTGPDQPF